MKKPLKLALDPNKTTIAEAQVAIKPFVRGAGVFCPCCLQLVKLTNKSITTSMAYVLILLHRHYVEDPNWLHVPKYLEVLTKIGTDIKGCEWQRLQIWGLLEAQPEDKKAGKKFQGFYRITEKGNQFAKDLIKVPEYAFLYEGQTLGFGTKEVSIRDCLGTSYKYEDLMAGKVGTV